MLHQHSRACYAVNDHPARYASVRRITGVLTRQKILLAMLREAGNEAWRIQVMKWLFLFSAEAPSRSKQSCYQFVPYRYGPCSFVLYHEIDALIRDGFIESENPGDPWRLTDIGRAAPLSLSDSTRRDIRSIISKYGSMNLEELKDVVYERYPWYTVNCEEPGKRRVQRPLADIAIYTVGYEGLSIDDFLNRLLKTGIKRVIDVRSNPISRRYGYHECTFMRLCNSVGIEYTHVSELGIPSSERSSLSNPSDYERLFARYRQTTLNAHPEAICKVARMLRDGPSVLVCREADPAFCHRALLAQALQMFVDLPIVHLEWPR